MNDGPEPDGLEKGLRFGCGFLFGGAIFFFALGRLIGADSFWLIVGACAVISGLLAIRYGDRIFHMLLSFFRWW